MKIGMLGCGAMGSILGAQLTRAGVSTTLIDKWVEHVDAMCRGGLTVSTDEGYFTVAVRALTRPDPLEKFDIVVILVKSQATAEAATIAKDMLSEGGAVVSFQNGLGNEAVISGIVGMERTIGGTIYFGGNVIGPAHVKKSQLRGKIAVGALSEGARSAARALSAALNEAQFDCEVQDDVLALKWQKALVNMGVNAFATILNEPNRVAGDRPSIRAAMEACSQEAIAVARAKGVALPGGDDPKNYVRQGTDVHNYEHRSSMALDLAAGKMTDVNVRNGVIERLGQ